MTCLGSHLNSPPAGRERQAGGIQNSWFQNSQFLKSDRICRKVGGINLAAAMSHQPTVLAPPAVCMMSLPASLVAGNLNIANIGGLANDVS